MEKTKGNRYKLHWERFHLDIRQTFFYNKNNKLLEQPPQGHGRMSITGGFQYVIQQDARLLHLGSLFPMKD